MKNRKTLISIVLLALTLICTTSCRWDIWGSTPADYGQGTGGPSSSFMFSGEAPRYVSATKARFADKVVVSWNAVTGADYYEIYRAEVSNDGTVPSSFDWKRMNRSPVDDTHFVDDDISATGLYAYTVRAMNFAYPNIHGEFSEPATYGWALTPPTGVVASQGESSKSINIKWNPVNNIIGYRIYWSSTGYGGTWNVAIPEGLEAYDYVFPANVTEFAFVPEKQYKGSSLFFYIESCSQSGSVSAPSAQRMGYTFVEGAPLPPKEFSASRGVSTGVITLKWVSMKGTDAEGNPESYDWEIYRSADGESEKKIYSTLDGDSRLDDTGEYMTYEDSSNVKPGVRYTYSVRAIGKVMNEETGQMTLANGLPSNADGYLLSPPTSVHDVKITTNEAGVRGFEFTFDDALGVGDAGVDTSKWSYIIWRSVEKDGPYDEYMTIPVGDPDRTVFSPYDGVEEKYQYFDITTSNGAHQSVGHSDGRISGKPIGVFSPRSAENFNASDNLVTSGVGAVDGFYPVSLSMTGEEYISTYNVRVWKEKPASFDTPGYEEFTRSVDNPAEVTRLDAGMVRINDVGTTPIGTRYYYSVQGVDILGREGDWSSFNDGYSAITGNVLIKYMQPYALKPWEYIGKPVLTSEYPYPDKNVNQKWSNSAIYAKIKQAGTGSLTSGMTETSYFHGGKIKYAAAVQGIGAKITFTYTNFGEVEYMKNNGFFMMVVDAGGSGSCSGNFQIDGMYPASIGLGNMSVSSQAFTGTYTVRQQNGTGSEEVSPDQRY